MFVNTNNTGKRKRSHISFDSGFTLVELIIVIVVIGILAAIILVAYSGVTERAKVSSYADGLKKVEKAMQLYIVEKGYSAWPKDSDLTGSANPTINSIISDTSGFSNYLQSAPNVDGISPSLWRYDNDLDTYNGCSVSSNGANIYTTSTPNAFAKEVDKTIDDGDLTCGRVRWYSTNDGTLVYNVSDNK